MFTGAIIGVTGMPATGKSVFSKKLHEAFEQLGVHSVLINTDQFAKNVLSDKNIREMIQQAFGCDPMNADEVIEKVYKSNSSIRNKYAMTMRHLLVGRLYDYVSSLNCHIVVMESALLFEYNIQVDMMMLMTSDNKQLIQDRTNDQIERHLLLEKLQIPVEYKKMYSDVIVENNGDIGLLDAVAVRTAKYIFETTIVNKGH